MPQILEATMLICFGFSWPMSVYKNIKAKTAKSMSLPFILLIVTGYIAGIAAKLWTNTINYVLVVYVLNLLIVSSNVVVYFINRRYDKAAERAAAVSEAPAAVPGSVGSAVEPEARSGYGVQISAVQQTAEPAAIVGRAGGNPARSARP